MAIHPPRLRTQTARQALCALVACYVRNRAVVNVY
jgi:hypothetical protein